MTSIIAIAGPSGSGKTTLAVALEEQFRLQVPQLVTAILTEDAYYRDQAHLSLTERAVVNYDHPDALEHELLDAHLSLLRRGKSVAVPMYDYKIHNRRRESRHLPPPALLIVEGILLLSRAELRRHFATSVFLDLPLDLCLSRRIRRDSAERGRSPEFVQDQFEATVRPMYQQFVKPSQRHAEAVIEGDFDPEATARRLSEQFLARLPVSPQAKEGQRQG